MTTLHCSQNNMSTTEKDSFRGKSVSEITDDWRNQLKALSSEIYIEDRCVVFGCNNRTFIELKRLNTTGKLLAYVRHVCTKPWMTPERLRYFIDLVDAQYPKMRIRRSF